MTKLPPLPERPLVSIIIPSFNQGMFIGKTIESFLSQSYRPIEVLILDGASTDETLNVIKSFQEVPELNWWSEPDTGVVEAVNKGFERAHGEICAIQSSDDYYLPGAFDLIVEHMKKNPKVGLVYGDSIKVDIDGNEIWKEVTMPFNLENFLSKKTWIPQPSAFFRLQLIKELGGWDDKFFNADTELWLRMAFRTQVHKIDSFLSKRREHDAQRNKQAEKIVESYWRMIDTSKDIKDAAIRLQRAAQCGKYLHAAKYNPTGRSWMQNYYNWRALIAYPEVLERLDFPGALVPGYYMILKHLSKFKRLFQNLY